MRILLADPEFNVRYGLTALLEEQFDLEVVGEVADTEALYACIQKCCPDLLLLSWEFPGVAASELISHIRRTCPYITIFVLSIRREEEHDAFTAGADDFISKADPPEQLVARIRSVSQEKGKKGC